MKTASWVVIRKSTGEALFETFSAAIIKALNTDNYEAIPILEYLASINGRKK